LFSAGGRINIEIKCKNCKYLNKFQMDVADYKSNLSATQIRRRNPDVRAVRFGRV